MALGIRDLIPRYRDKEDISLRVARVDDEFDKLLNDNKFKIGIVKDASGFASSLLERIANEEKSRGRIVGLDIESMRAINEAGDGDQAIENLIKGINSVISRYPDFIEFGRIRGDMFMVYFDYDHDDKAKSKLCDEVLSEIKKVAGQIMTPYKFVIKDKTLETKKGISLHDYDFGELNQNEFNNLKGYVALNGFVPDKQILSNNLTPNQKQESDRILETQFYQSDSLSVDDLVKKRAEIIARIGRFLNQIPSLKEKRLTIFALSTEKLGKILFTLEKRYTNPNFTSGVILTEARFGERINDVVSICAIDFGGLKYINEGGDYFGDRCIDMVWGHIDKILLQPKYLGLRGCLVFSKHYYKPMIALDRNSSGKLELFKELVRDINNSSFLFELPFDDSSVNVPLTAQNTTISPEMTITDPSRLIEKQYSSLERKSYENIFSNSSQFSLYKMVLEDARDTDKDHFSLSPVLNSYENIYNYFFNTEKRGAMHVQQFVGFLLNDLLQTDPEKRDKFYAEKKSLLNLMFLNTKLRSFMSKSQYKECVQVFRESFSFLRK